MRPVLRAHEIDARKADENAEALTQRDRLVIDQQTSTQASAMFITSEATLIFQPARYTQIVPNSSPTMMAPSAHAVQFVLPSSPIKSRFPIR